MIKNQTTPELLSSMFYYIANCYDDKHFPDLCVVYQFLLTEQKEEYAYYISIENGVSEVHEGRHRSPSLAISATVVDLFNIFKGALNPYWGFATRKYRVQGSLHDLMQMRKVFNKAFDHTDIPELDNETGDFEIPSKRVWKKPQKVLVINASPRRLEGYTYFYLRSLLEGIQAAGTRVEWIELYDPNIRIESCRGCLSCWSSTYGQCVIQDDAAPLVKQIDEASLILYAFPLYIGSVPDKLKRLMDRSLVLLTPYCASHQGFVRHPRRRKKEQYTALFVISGLTGAKQFQPVIDTFKLETIGFHRPLLAAMIRPGAKGLYDIPFFREDLHRVLAALKQAGTELIENGRISRKILKTISRPYIPKSLFHRAWNIYWHLNRHV
jgi:multimeric flavodoxin WrbA